MSAENEMSAPRFDIEREWAADDPRRQDLDSAGDRGTDRRDAPVLGGDGVGNVVSVQLSRELADELREWSAPAQIRVRAGSAGYELEVRSASSSGWLREQARKLNELAEQIEGAGRERRSE